MLFNALLIWTVPAPSSGKTNSLRLQEVPVRLPVPPLTPNMRKSIYYLLSLLAAAFLIIVLLVWTAPSPNKQRNGFNRLYLRTAPVQPYATIPVHEKILDIAGVYDSVIYLSVANDPATLIAATLTPQLHTDTFHISLPDSLTKAMGNAFFTEVNKDDIFVYGYNIPSVYKTSRNSAIPSILARYTNGGFSQAHSTRNGNHIILRKLDVKKRDQFFVRVTTNNDSILLENDLSEVHRDGGVSTDGSLNYDPTTGLFTYLHYYSNRYFTFDSLLQIEGTGHTIDTFSTSRFNVAGTFAREQNLYTNQGPDQMVNGFSCAHNNTLFVQAKLKADNDDDRQFYEHAVIDMYDLKTNKYKGSFYLNISPRTKINQLYVHNNILLVHCNDNIYCIKITY